MKTYIYRYLLFLSKYSNTFAICWTFFLISAAIVAFFGLDYYLNLATEGGEIGAATAQAVRIIGVFVLVIFNSMNGNELYLRMKSRYEKRYEPFVWQRVKLEGKYNDNDKYPTYTCTVKGYTAKYTVFTDKSGELLTSTPTVSNRLMYIKSLQGDMTEAEGRKWCEKHLKMLCENE